jgi:hypothetical protein
MHAYRVKEAYVHCPLVLDTGIENFNAVLPKLDLHEVPWVIHPHAGPESINFGNATWPRDPAMDQSPL